MERVNKASFVLFTAEEVAEGAEEESKDIEKEQKVDTKKIAKVEEAERS